MLGLRKRSSRAELLCLRLPKAGKGPTAVTTLSKRWAIVEAKAAAISTLELQIVPRLKAQLRRLEPKAFLWGSRALATSLGRLAAGSFVERGADDSSGEGCSDLIASASRALLWAHATRLGFASGFRTELL